MLSYNLRLVLILISCKIAFYVLIVSTTWKIWEENFHQNFAEIFCILVESIQKESDQTSNENTKCR